jgi:hypothetical protein
VVQGFERKRDSNSTSASARAQVESSSSGVAVPYWRDGRGLRGVPECCMTRGVDVELVRMSVRRG